MAANRVIDFDKAWSEHQRAQIPAADLPDIRMFGAVFPRKAELPAAVTLMASRLGMPDASSNGNGEGSEGLNLDGVIDLLRLMVPDEVIDEWLFEQGLSESDLQRAFLSLYSLYQGVTPDDGDGDSEGEAQAPKGGSSVKSSNGGRGSKRTSNASTRST